MVHHGHKTEELVHALTNQSSLLNILKARKVNFLCLSSIAVIGLVMGGVMIHPSLSLAQDSPVYNATAAQTEIRVQQLETQIRELTGKVEEQVYEINALKQKVKMVEDMAMTNTSVVAPQQPAARINNQMGDAPQPLNSGNMNPLGLDLDASNPNGMQTATVIPANNDATALYEQAYSDLKNSNYEQAQKGFDSFLSGHSNHVLAANAKYWLGETYYVQGDYKKSARVFAEGFQTYPDSAKTPDILLKLGMSLKGMGKKNEACIALSQVAVKFPSGHEDVVKRADQERASLSCDA